jgi:hypothetical protein
VETLVKFSETARPAPAGENREQPVSRLLQPNRPNSVAAQPEPYEHQEHALRERRNDYDDAEVAERERISNGVQPEIGERDDDDIDQVTQAAR